MCPLWCSSGCRAFCRHHHTSFFGQVIGIRARSCSLHSSWSTGRIWLSVLLFLRNFRTHNGTLIWIPSTPKAQLCRQDVTGVTQAFSVTVALAAAAAEIAADTSRGVTGLDKVVYQENPCQANTGGGINECG